MDTGLDAWRSRDDLTLDEMVEAADGLLRTIAPKQTRYAVAERPDVRTIRYYTTRGLLPKPLSYEGGRARYGFAHLVRLLAIKRMQAEHMTLDQIARSLADQTDDVLVPFVTADAGSAAAPASAVRVEASQSTSTSSPTAPVLAEKTIERVSAALELELAPGGKLIVPADVVGDAAGRERLAQNLEALARMLRAMSGSSGSSSNQGGNDV